MEGSSNYPQSPPTTLPETATVRIVCISDTHNDDVRAHIPPGDVFVHAGDITECGTQEELEVAFEWISSLPHRTKVIVAGNHDFGLDLSHRYGKQKVLDLFTSAKAKACGIYYLSQETREVSLPSIGDSLSLAVYGNPYHPDFRNSSYAFTYKPYPSPAATAHWSSAPKTSAEAALWITHGPPKDRLDKIPTPGLQGCVAQAQKIAAARPLLCVFGHFHASNRVERVRWNEDCDEVAEARVVTRRGGEEEVVEYDLSSAGGDEVVGRGRETVFVNAAWMTERKREVEKRNRPVVIKLDVPVIRVVAGE